MTASTITTPGVQLARYAAPTIQITPVTAVVPTTSIKGGRPGHYQHVVLNTATGELCFHEGTEHLEEWNPQWMHRGDIPRETRARWYPGTMWTGTGPHMWFQPVPQKLYWVIDTGGTWWPYLGVNEANELLQQLALYAQNLLDNLVEAGGELDWSAASVRAGRQIDRLTDRERKAAGPEQDSDLVDYTTLVQQFPQVYRPRLLEFELDKLAQECEYLTRFLGCNENWHPEIKKKFGRRSHDGTWVHLDVLGIRAWYRTLLLDGDPRPEVTFADWDRAHHVLDGGQIRSTSTDEDLQTWVTNTRARAAETGVRLTGVGPAARAHRDLLRQQDWDRLKQVGYEIARLQRQLAAAEAERTHLGHVARTWKTDADVTAQERLGR